MQTKSLIAMAAVGMTAAIAIPTIAFGNARSTLGNLSYIHAAQTPLIARLSGANEVPVTSTAATGAASVTIDVIDAASATGAEVCWDLSYSGITGPTVAHIHAGAAGTNGSIMVALANLDATSATRCVTTAGSIGQQILDNPAGFYVDVHTTDPVAGVMRGQLEMGPPPAGEAHLLRVPLRAYDSRDNSGVKIAALETRTISLATGKDALGTSFIAVPPGATAAMVTLTATSTSGNGGFLKLYSAAITEPATSSINWSTAGENVAVSTTVAVDATGRVKVTAGANSTHFVIDVIGYLF
jgi:hypothetical protein